MVGGIVQGIPCFATPISTRSSLDQIASFGPCPPSILSVSLVVRVVSARGLRGDGPVGDPTPHRTPVHRDHRDHPAVYDHSERRRRRCGIGGVSGVAHLLHSTSYSPSWVRVHDSTSPANTAHVHPSVFTSTAEAKSVPLKIKCILQGMQGSKL